MNKATLALKIAEQLSITKKEAEDFIAIFQDVIIDALKKNKIIRKFNTTIDWKRAGVEKVYAVIQVKVMPQERAGFSKIAREIANDSRVFGVYVASGEYDLMVYVQGNNIDEISDFTTDKLAPKKDVVGTNTHIILKVFKKDGAEFFDNEVERLKVSP